MHNAIRAGRIIVAGALAADRKGVVVATLLGVLAWIAIPLQAVAVKVFVDAGTSGDGSRLAVASVVLAVVLGGVWYVNSLRQFVSYGLYERTHHELDQRLQRLVGELDGIEHLERPDYLDRVTTLQAQSHQFGNIDDIIDLPGLVLNLVFTAILLVTLNPLLLFVPIAAIPPLWATGRSEGFTRAAEAAVAPHRRMRRTMLELATGAGAASEARLFEAGRELVARHRVAEAAYDRGLERAQIREFLLISAGWIVYAIAFAAAFLIVVPDVRSGRLNIGDLFLFFYLVRGIGWQAEWTMWSVVGVRRTLTAAQNYLWLEDYSAEQPHTPAAPRALPLGSLRLENVSFRYPGTERDVLSDVTLDVPPGSTLALVGDNGAGKTTIVKLLADFYRPSAGRITVGGVDLAEVDARAWRTSLSACLQEFSRFEFRARETVGVGSLPEIDDRERVQRAVGAAGAADVVAHLEHGLETQLGTAWDGGAELSAGQWQKLALGRGMMRDRPRLLLLDEPTAALDAAAEAALFERYAAASAFAAETGSITIIVSHRMSTVRMADLIAVVEGGRLREFGTHEQLLAAAGPYRELYQTQASAYAT